MQLKSEAFQEGSEIPRRFTCEGDNVSPPLNWNGVPPQTRSLALICEDPDAPIKTFVHWLIYDMPPGQTLLMADRPREPVLLGGARQGKNGFGRIGYGGPCPPTAPSHRYYFTLYALDLPPGFEPGIHKRELEAAMEGHVLAKAQLMGRYRKVSLGRFMKTLLLRR